MRHTFDVFVGRAVLAPALVLCLSSAATATAETVVLPPVALQRTIQIPAELRPLIDRMVQTSHTFRRQYERILTTPRLIVHVRLSSALLELTIRARTVIRRYDSGLLVAMVEIGPGAGEWLWIAHEFEHVLEQVDGAPIRALADRSAAGTWQSGRGMIETRRAVRIGRRVIGEMRERRRSHKYVE